MLDLPPPQVHCLAQAIWHEARSESDIGQRAVAHVLLNRAIKNKSSVCTELHRAGQFQIKFKKHYTGKAWKKAYQIATNPGKDPTGRALFFKNVKCKTVWKYRLTTSIGKHNYYK